MPALSSNQLIFSGANGSEGSQEGYLGQKFAHSAQGINAEFADEDEMVDENDMEEHVRAMQEDAEAEYNEYGEIRADGDRDSVNDLLRVHSTIFGCSNTTYQNTEADACIDEFAGM